MKKLAVGCIMLAFITLAWGEKGWGEQVPVPKGELRVVDKHPLNWIFLVYNVFEHLVEIDRHGKLVPRLATSWRWVNDRTLEVALRQGVHFHNGEVFNAEIVKLNWEENTRFKQAHIPGKFLNFTPGSQLEIIDPYTVRFIFPEPDGGTLAKLALMHIGNRQFYRELGWGEKSW